MVQCGVPAVIKSIPSGIPQLSDPSPRYSRNIHTDTRGNPADSVGFPPSPSPCTPLLCDDRCRRTVTALHSAAAALCSAIHSLTTAAATCCYDSVTYKRLCDVNSIRLSPSKGGSVAEWLACWTRAQKARVHIAVATQSGNITVLGKLLTPIVPLFTKQQNW